MKRRDFAKVMATLTASLAPQIGRPFAETVLEVFNHFRFGDKLESVDPQYVVSIAPSMYRDLHDISAREKWRTEWRRQRLERQGIVETHGQRWHGYVLGWYPAVVGCIGRIEGVRILQAEEP